MAAFETRSLLSGLGGADVGVALVIDPSEGGEHLLENQVTLADVVSNLLRNRVLFAFPPDALEAPNGYRFEGVERLAGLVRGAELAAGGDDGQEAL